MVTYTLTTTPLDSGTFALAAGQWDWCMLSSTRMLMVYMQQSPNYLYAQVIDLNGTATPTYRTPHVLGSWSHNAPNFRLRRLDGTRALLMGFNSTAIMARVLVVNGDFTVTSGTETQATQNSIAAGFSYLPVVPNSSLCLLHYFSTGTATYMVTLGISGTTVTVTAAETPTPSSSTFYPVQFPMSDGRIFQSWPHAAVATSPHGSGFRDSTGAFTALPSPPTISGARHYVPLRNDRILLTGTTSGSVSFAALYDGTAWGAAFQIAPLNSNIIATVVLDDYHFMYLTTGALVTGVAGLTGTVYRYANSSQLVMSSKGNVAIDSAVYNEYPGREFVYKINDQTVLLVYRRSASGQIRIALCFLTQPA